MRPGDLLAAKYRIEHLLGSGAMGAVWAAVNESTNRPVAIKLMHTPTADLRIRMLREARAVGTLKHKNIVDLYDVGEAEGGEPFLVMERLSGETLADRLDFVERLPESTAVEIATAIAAALRAAHGKGIIHRDLKPSNVFLHRETEGEGEIVKVVDFGVSKHLQDSGGTTGSLVGSPAYMSPEQASQETKIDGRSDLWSLGVVLFQMLSGRRPFPSSSPYLVLTEVVSAPIPNLADVVPGISPALAHVVDRCLTRDVDARVQSADELIRLLGAARDEDASSESEPTTKVEAAPRSTEPTTKELEDRARRASLPSTHPPVLVLGRGGSVLGRSPSRGPSNAIVAAVAGAAAVVLIVAFAVMLRKATPTAETVDFPATPPSAPPQAEAAKPVSPSLPEPMVAPAAPASEPAPQPGDDDASLGVDAPATSGAAPDHKRNGVTSSRAAYPLPPHPDGKKRLQF